MTLDTTVYVLDETDPHELFAKCRELIGATDRTRWYDEQDKTYVDGSSFVEPGNPWSIGNHLGQGLPAILEMAYRRGAPLRTPEQSAEHDVSICNLPGVAWYSAQEGDCDGHHPYSPACWAEVSFETSYTYDDAQGRTCGALHGDLVTGLGRWLDAKGVRWSWQNEYTGEVHTGYDRLVDLVRTSADTKEWFFTTVLPWIRTGHALVGIRRRRASRPRTAPAAPSALNAAYTRRYRNRQGRR